MTGTLDRPARMPGLDALRAAALLLGIGLHALGPFLPGDEWVVNDRNSTALADDAVYVIHLFRMTLFMVLAGYFGRMLVHRRGAKRYLRDRAGRVLLPVFVFWPFAVAPLIIFGALAAPTPHQQEGAPGVSDFLLLLTPAHLWFLLVLFECVVITLAVRQLAYRTLGAQRCARLSERIGDILTHSAGVLLVAVPYFVALLVQGPEHSFGLETPETFLPTASSLIAYSGAFLTGWLMHGRPPVLNWLMRRWSIQLIIAMVLTGIGLSPLYNRLPFIIEAACTALAGWTWTFGLIGVSLRFIVRERPVARYLADASYWMYLMHLPVLTGIAFVIADLDWSIPVKLIGTLVVTTLILVISYDLMVRQTRIGGWLNGRRHPSLLLTRRGQAVSSESR